MNLIFLTRPYKLGKVLTVSQTEVTWAEDALPGVRMTHRAIWAAGSGDWVCVTCIWSQRHVIAPSVHLASRCSVPGLRYLVVFFVLFYYFCLCWVFVAMCRLSLVVTSGSGGYSLLGCTGSSLQWLLLLLSVGFSGCSTMGSVVVAGGYVECILERDTDKWH